MGHRPCFKTALTLIIALPKTIAIIKALAIKNNSDKYH